MQKTFKVFVTSLAVMAGAIVATPSAQATGTLLAGDSKLRVFSCDETSAGDNANNAGMLNINPSTLEGTLVSNSQASCGTHQHNGATNGNYIDSAAFNPDDSKVYAVVRNSSASFYVGMTTFDMVDGTSTSALPFAFSTAPTTQVNRSFYIAINPTDTSQVFAWDYSTASTSSGGTHGFYSLNLTPQNGFYILTEIVPDLGITVSQFAYSATGQLYAWSADHLEKIGTDGTHSTVAGTDWGRLSHPFAFDRIRGMAFDSQGTLFLNSKETDSGNSMAQLWAAKTNGRGGFLEPQVVTGSNPDTTAPNTLWTNNIGTAIDGHTTPVGSIESTRMRAPIVITYGKAKITFKGQGGTPSLKSKRFTSASQLIVFGGQNVPFALPTATRTGYTLDGWYDAATGGTLAGKAGDSYTVPTGSEDDYNLYAHWTKSGSGGSGSGGSSSGGSGSGAGSHSVVKAKIYFDAGSVALNKASKKKLRRLAHKYNSAVTIVVKGYVQSGTNPSNDYKLSLARAKAVAKYLKKQGLTAKIIVKGNGTPSAKPYSSKARRATVYITIK